MTNERTIDDPFRRRLQERYARAVKECRRWENERRDMRMRLDQHPSDTDPNPPGTAQRGRQAA